VCAGGKVQFHHGYAKQILRLARQRGLAHALGNPSPSRKPKSLWQFPHGYEPPLDTTTGMDKAYFLPTPSLARASLAVIALAARNAASVPARILSAPALFS
jgi:hypothetical protein